MTEKIDAHLRRPIGDLVVVHSWQDARLEVWQMLESPYASGPDLAAGPTSGQFRSIRKNLANIHPRLVPCTYLTRQLKKYLGIPTSESDPEDTGVTWRVERVLVPVPSPGGKPLKRDEPLTAQDMRIAVDALRHTHVTEAYNRLVPLYALIERDPAAAAVIVDELKRLGY